MNSGRLFLWVAWGFSILSQVLTWFTEPGGPGLLILAVLSLAILGLIFRLDELEQQIAGHAPEPEPKPELDLEEVL
jgi:hypothetical protein